MKTESVVAVYKLINESKLTKMEDADKFKMIKIMRAMKPIATSYEDFQKDAQEKLKDDDFEVMQKRAQDLQSNNGQGSPEEFKEVNAYYEKYYKSLNDFLKPELEKENDFSYEKLSEDAFGKYLASNDFKMDEILKIEEAVCTPA